MANYKKHKTAAASGEIERLDPLHTPWYSRRLLNEHLARYLFAASFCKDKIVVEMGCGLGYGTRIIAHKGAKKVYGIDIDKKAVTFAKLNYHQTNIRFLSGDVCSTKLKNNYADIIVSFETIEHVRYPGKMISEIKRILKPGGMLILSTPNKETSLGINPYHITEFSIRELDKLLTSFKKRKYYGQGKAILSITEFYKKIAQNKLSTFLHKIIQLRPWEGYNIYPVKNKSVKSGIYIIAVCKK